jgi:hypothetical protein
MSALFSVAFSSIFLAIGIAAVIGHVVLIDVLLRPTAVHVAQAPAIDAAQTRQVR